MGGGSQLAEQTSLLCTLGCGGDVSHCHLAHRALMPAHPTGRRANALMQLIEFALPTPLKFKLMRGGFTAGQIHKIGKQTVEQRKWSVESEAPLLRRGTPHCWKEAICSGVRGTRSSCTARIKTAQQLRGVKCSGQTR